MNTPRQAVIFAAGFGTRLEPLTRGTPKCLLPLWGRPLIDYTLARLAAWGVQEVLVNLHHAPQPLFDHLRGLALQGLRVACSYEPEILGTGGALLRASWFPATAPFWIVNGDIDFDLDPAPLLNAFQSHKAIAALWMTDAAGPRTVELVESSGSRGRSPSIGFGNKQLEGEQPALRSLWRSTGPASRYHSSQVRTFRSQTPGAPGTVTFCGLQLVSPSILNHVPQRPFSSIVEAYERAQRQGHRVIGVKVPGSRWIDIGTPEGLLNAHRQTASAHARQQRAVTRALKRRGVHASGVVALGAEIQILRGAQLHDVVIMDRTRIAADADIQETILGPGVDAHGSFRRMGVALTAAGDRELSAIAARFGWPAARVSVQPLAPRGSARTFTRMACGWRRALIIRYGKERPENARFAGHARFLLRQGLRVPKILIDRPDQRLCVVEDLGDLDLAMGIQHQSDAKVLRQYRTVLDAVAHWHTKAGPAARRQHLALEPAFGPTLFGWEHNLFRNHLVVARARLPLPACRRAFQELQEIAARLAREPQTLVHRDLQSSNVLLYRRQPFFIDFQGMRRGPAVYDLASLLADPYVMLSESMQFALLDHYASAAGIRNRNRLIETFWYAVVQRLVQALGAYGRLSRLPGTAGFSRHILPALDMLDRALTHVYTGAHLTTLVRKLRAAEAQRGTA